MISRTCLSILAVTPVDLLLRKAYKGYEDRHPDPGAPRQPDPVFPLPYVPAIGSLECLFERIRVGGVSLTLAINLPVAKPICHQLGPVAHGRLDLQLPVDAQVILPPHCEEVKWSIE